jgi:small subunit ribosomal protein S16
MFRLVLTDSKNSPKSGKFLEILGNYNARNGDLVIKEDRVKHWLKQGAQSSDTVYNMLIDRKIIIGKKINKLPKKTAPEIKKEENLEVKTEVKDSNDQSLTKEPKQETETPAVEVDKNSSDKETEATE